MWGIIPAAGAGSRIQPLAFSKELLPVGCRVDRGVERPRAVSEYLIERMIAGGADKLCFVIAPGKTDILEYFGSRIRGADIVYVVQPQPGGLCDAVFRATRLIAPDETVVIGLPDTIWTPQDALCRLPDDQLGFLLFPVEHPELFDAVATDEHGSVTAIHVKQRNPPTKWIWGAIKMPGRVFHSLHELWLQPERGDEYLGTLVNAWLARGGAAAGIRSGQQYVDVGTLHGYREALRILDGSAETPSQASTPKEENTPPHELVHD
jgi:dTDP-glucose pyrophosphorylase